MTVQIWNVLQIVKVQIWNMLQISESTDLKRAPI